MHVQDEHPAARTVACGFCILSRAYDDAVNFDEIPSAASESAKNLTKNERRGRTENYDDALNITRHGRQS